MLPTGFAAPAPTHRYVPPLVATGTLTLNGTRLTESINLPISEAGRATSTKASINGRITASGAAQAGSKVDPGLTAAFCW